jgi:hypothetical protein
LEVKEKTDEKERKCNTKEQKVKEREAQKKQKKDQKISHPHFSDFIKAKSLTG